MEIPTDIILAAVEALLQSDWKVGESGHRAPEDDPLQVSVWHEPGDVQVSEMRVYPVALAILAERQRCARVAEEMARRHEEEAPFEEHDEWKTARLVYAKHVRKVASAILSPAEKETD